ncbi:adenylyltransferase/cytidyltransferase family protein [Vibrio vulnificus]|nr:adenylyltransferase/cytidyltransferase family protein [Vibrio vulnificus]
MKKIGVFGSAFNPPSKGHMSVISRAAKEFDEIWVIPSANHAFGKDMLPLALRERMVKALIEDIGNSQVKLVSCEPQVSDGVVYTIDLLDFLAENNEGCKFVFLCGEDNIAAFHKFHRAQEILDRHEVQGFNVIDDIRSTYIRNSVSGGTSEWKNMVSPSVQRVVLELIDSDNIYI